MGTINLDKTLQEVKRLARDVGKYQLEKMNQKINVSQKSSYLDLVSEVDKISEEKIVNWIESNYPQHSILAEERGTNEKDSRYKWVIDPLDGTTNYIHGFPIFSISIGLMENETPVLGVIYTPYLDELYSAVKGKGAYLNDKKIKVSNKSRLKESLLVTGFPYNLTEDKYNNIDIFNKLLFESRGVRRIGSAAYDLGCVASGKLDAFWELKLSPWDVKAGIIIVQEAGGKIIETDYHGHYLIVAGPDKLTDNLYDEIIKVHE